MEWWSFAASGKYLKYVEAVNLDYFRCDALSRSYLWSCYSWQT